jgi:AcrR family transcriptional regulator
MSSALGLGDPPSAAPVARRLTGDQRRQQLVAVALELFADRGYRATTMDHIADAAGVTKPLVYQHFSSKRALYLELVDAVGARLVEAIEAATAVVPGPRQQVERGFAAYFEFVLANPAAFRLLYGRHSGQDEELGAPLRQVEGAIAEAIDPLIDAGLDPEHRRTLAYGVVGLAEGASRYWLSRGKRGRPAVERAEAARIAARMADLAWAGLRSVHAD